MREEGSVGGGGGETAVPTVLISCLPTRFFPSASGYLLIGYSKISETRRYRQKKRGRRRGEKTRESEEEGNGGRGGWKGGGGGGRGRGGGRKERAQGGRVVADRTRARVGVNYHYPPKTRLSFCSPRVPFCFFPRCPTRPHPPTHPPQPHPIPPSESFDSSARLCHPPSPRFIRPLILRSLPPSTASSLHLTSYHRPPKIRVRYYLSPDRSRSTTPANVLFRSLPRRILLPLVRGHPTITGPRTI